MCVRGESQFRIHFGEKCRWSGFVLFLSSVRQEKISSSVELHL